MRDVDKDRIFKILIEEGLLNDEQAAFIRSKEAVQRAKALKSRSSSIKRYNLLQH